MASVLITSASGRKTLFNDGWQFNLTDSLTVGMPVGAIADSLWQDIRLPHDWSVTLPFNRNAARGNDGGYLPKKKTEKY